MSEPKFLAGDIVQHRKGGKYRVLGQGIFTDIRRVYIYRDVATAQLYVRDPEEMEDGRFTLVFRRNFKEGEE